MTKYNGMNFAGFVVPSGSIPHKVKEFLLWTGEHYPDMWVSPAVITQVIFNLGRLPGVDNINLKQVRASFSATHKSLLKHHKKGLARNKDTNEVRVTTSDLDAAHQALVPRAKRFVSARDALAETRNIINRQAIPNTAENREILKLVDEASRVVKNSNNSLKEMWQHLLLPEKTETSEG